MVQNNELSLLRTRIHRQRASRISEPRTASDHSASESGFRTRSAGSNITVPNRNSVGQATATTPGATASDSSSVVCSTCGTVNAVPSSDTHYTITVGKSVGVFSDLAFVQAQVMGVSGACFKRYPSQAAALQAYHHAVIQAVVRIVNV
ncbi:hypothetical protein BT96DRAFT_937174 [Gymnopus androsaceus JB14]|uniref:Ribonuclease H1 N-terminal domain-containing protein n=1 Tax=Gymnopus androsaceus JB14 TaxID=1447944 RepID=A0A6A4HXT0_9AGAR|nr:hypothetical protein BT96DRAFT_937174 [Gymnopus androsaceus JB14]